MCLLFESLVREGEQPWDERGRIHVEETIGEEDGGGITKEEEESRRMDRMCRTSVIEHLKWS